jgi:hypothetical protein
MANRTTESVFCQLQSEREALAASGELPFRELLGAERILEVLQCCNVEFRERVYSPMVTLWAFLSQVIRGAGD